MPFPPDFDLLFFLSTAKTYLKKRYVETGRGHQVSECPEMSETGIFQKSEKGTQVYYVDMHASMCVVVYIISNQLNK